VTEAVGVNKLPKVVTQLCPGGNWTHELLIASPMPYRCTIYSHSLQVDITLEKLRNLKKLRGIFAMHHLVEDGCIMFIFELP